MECSPPGSTVHEIFQARIMEWIAFPLPGDLPDPETELTYPALACELLTTERIITYDKLK